MMAVGRRHAVLVLLATTLLAVGCGDGGAHRALPRLPPSLRTSLHMPRLVAGGSCPVSPTSARTFMGRVAGHGPVYIAGIDDRAVLPLSRPPNSAWARQQVVVLATARYQGPVLIRGRQLNGRGVVGFGGNRRPDAELRLRAPGVSTVDEPVGWRAWLALIRVRAGGCHAFQIDGTTFSQVIVFEARLR